MKSLKGHMLIASPKLVDPNFRQSVVLLVQHNEQGALGVVLNRPLELTIRQAAEQVLGGPCEADGVLHHGGPCESMLAVVYTDADGLVEVEGDPVIPGLFFTNDRPAIERLLATPGIDADSARFFVGYAGWGPQQLEGELSTGSWLTTPATLEQVLGASDTLWQRLNTEVNLRKYVDPSRIPPDPRTN